MLFKPKPVQLSVSLKGSSAFGQTGKGSFLDSKILEDEIERRARKFSWCLL